MIEEVVNSILEAEDVAQQKIAQAKREAADLVARAEIEADNFKKQSSAQNKEAFAQQSKQLEKQAEQNAAQQLASMNAETDKEISAYDKNVDSAVKIILGTF